MEIFKTMLMGCGALALLSVVGCVGMVGVGTYAVDQAIEEERAREASANRGNRSYRPKSTSHDDDPFGEYQSSTFDDDGDQVGGWGDEAQ